MASFLEKWKFKAYKRKAEKALKDDDEVENFLEELEDKLQKVPKLGKRLSDIPTLASMFRSYVIGVYDQVPLGVILAVFAALAYFVAPVDLLPDAIPGIGYLDDAGVLAVAYPFILDDLNKYRAWRTLPKPE